MSFNWLDMAVAFLLVAGAFRGYRRGLVREGMAFVGLLGGMVLASHYYPDAAALLEPFIGGGTLADALAYLGIVLVSLGCATLVTLAVRKLLHVLLVGWLDRVAGSLFGAVQGAFVALLLLYLIVRFQPFGLEAAVKESELSLAVLGLLPGAVEMLPPEFGSIGQLLQLPKR